MIVDATPDNITERLKEIGLQDKHMLAPGIRKVVRQFVKHKNLLIVRRYPDHSIDLACYERVSPKKAKK